MEQKYIAKITAAVKEHEPDYNTNFKYAKVLGIDPAQLSLILREKTDKVLSHQKWMAIARRLDVDLNGKGKWVTVQTPVFKYIYSQLKMCQRDSVSSLLCDKADIGKSYTAKQYVKENRNAIYVDCSQVKTKMRFIRKLAREFGLQQNGVYSEVYDDLVYYLRNGDLNPKPLIILDEAGDLKPDAFLELKALWNATEYVCGWYMMGADGLKAKIEMNLKYMTVGYTEIFSRYGSRYQTIVPDGKQKQDSFIKHQFMEVARANGISNLQEMFAESKGSLRRIYTEVQKMKQNNGESSERNAIN
jgi:hypothetical protein